MSEAKHEICGRLRRIAKRLDLSYQDIADRAELHVNTIYAIFDGATISPKFSTVARIVDAMDQGALEIIEQSNVVPLRRRHVR